MDWQLIKGLGFSGDAQVRRQQVEQVLNVLPLTAAVTLVNGLIVTVALYGHIDSSYLGGWLAAVVLLTLIRALSLYNYRRHTHRDREYPGAEKFIYFSVLVAGLLWGSTSLVLFSHGEAVYQLFLAFVLAGMAAGSVVALSQLFFPAALFSLLTLVPLMLHLFWHNTELSRAMGMLVLVYLVALLGMAWVNFRHSYSTILQRQSDTNRRRQAGEALDRMIEQREVFFSVCEDMICVVNFDGHFVDLNRRWRELLGYSIEELKLIPFLDLVHPDDAAATRGELHKLSGTGYRTINFVNRFHDKRGNWHWIRWSSGSRPDLKLIFATAHDITDIKEKEAQLEKSKQRLELEVQTRTHSLRESEQRLQYLLRESPAVIYTCQASGNYAATYVSENVQQLFGYAAEDFLRTPDFWISNIHPDDRQHIFTDLAPVFEKGWHRHEYRFRLPSGDYCWVRDEMRVVRDAKGEAKELIGYWINITDIRESEQALVETSNRFRAVVENAPEAFILLDNRGVILDVNANAGRMLGYETEELHGAGLFTSDLLQREVQLRDLWADILEGMPVRLDVNFKIKGGGVLPAEVYIGIYDSGSDQKVIMLARDISERVLREQELRVARDMAVQASAAKTDFLSRMSHELRTPMNAILGFAQLLELDDRLSASHRESVDEIRHAGEHLLQLIDEVLDLSRIEANRMRLNPESLSPAPLLQQCIGMVRGLAEEKQVSLQLQDADIEDLRINADATRFRQVLVNLLSNAVKYNRPGGKVSLSAEFSAADGGLCIAVTDNGIGIPRELHDKLFRPFSRLMKDQNAVQGTGIGLVISRKLTEMMGGALEFESEEGRGSSFRIRLPARRENVTMIDFSDRKTEAEEWKMNSGEQEQAHQGGGAYSIHYIEDNPANRRLVERVFQARPDIDLSCSGTAEEGLAAIRARLPNLILLDINLPGKGGYEVLKELRAEDGTRGIPVIAISANAMEADVKKGMQAGFEEYITKPIDISRLLTSVYTVLDSRQQSRRGA